MTTSKPSLTPSNSIKTTYFPTHSTPSFMYLTFNSLSSVITVHMYMHGTSKSARAAYWELHSKVALICSWLRRGALYTIPPSMLVCLLTYLETLISTFTPASGSYKLLWCSLKPEVVNVHLPQRTRWSLILCTLTSCEFFFVVIHCKKTFFQWRAENSINLWV